MDGKCELGVGDNQEELVAEVNDKHLKEGGALSVGDGTPVWLLNLFPSLYGSTDGIEKAFLATVYTIAYESGFYFTDGPCNRTSSYDIGVMRSLSDSNALVEHITEGIKRIPIGFTHNLMYPDKILKVVYYTLSGDRRNILSVIIFHLPEDNKVYSFMYRLNKYVTVTNKIELTEETAKLSLGIKDFLSTLKSYIFIEPYHPHHILSLPLHILQLICFYLNVKSFVQFTSTCKFLFNSFSDDEALWRYHSENIHRCLKKRSIDTWKEHFKYLTNRDSNSDCNKAMIVYC